MHPILNNKTVVRCFEYWCSSCNRCVIALSSKFSAFNVSKYLFLFPSGCITGIIPCCTCTDEATGVNVAGKVDPMTLECLCPCYCDPPTNEVISVKVCETKLNVVMVVRCPQCALRIRCPTLFMFTVGIISTWYQIEPTFRILPWCPKGLLTASPEECQNLKKTAPGNETTLPSSLWQVMFLSVPVVVIWWSCDAHVTPNRFPSDDHALSMPYFVILFYTIIVSNYNRKKVRIANVTIALTWWP